jgi:chromosomal replication initiation ATPase DnaA
LTSAHRQNLQTLTGPSGSGKTHLLRALERDHARAHTPGQVLRLAAADLVDLLARAAREKDFEPWRRLPEQGFALLLVDDLVPGRLGRRTRIEFAGQLDAFARAGTHVVVALAEEAGEPEDEGDALWALLRSGRTTRLRGPGLRARIGLARGFARELGADLAWTARLRLAWRTLPDAGLLRGAVKRWVADSTLVGKVTLTQHDWC